MDRSRGEDDALLNVVVDLLDVVEEHPAGHVLNHVCARVELDYETVRQLG